MNKGLIFGLGMAAGAGIGTGVTAFVVIRKCNKQKESEIEEVRAYYKQKCKKCDKNQVKEEENKAENVEKQPKNENKDEKLSQKVGLAEKDTASVGRKKVNREHVDYTKFSKISENYTGNEAKSLFEYPHNISEEEFDKDSDYEKVILTWYEPDDILADIEDRPTEYTVEDFGYQNFSDFGFEGMIYLRNEKTNTDFKIIHSELDFNQATGGVYLNDE